MSTTAYTIRDILDVDRDWSTSNSMSKRNRPEERAEISPIELSTERGTAPSWGQRTLLVCHRKGIQALSLQNGCTYTIGREAPADVVVVEPKLSRTHAKIQVSETSVLVCDQGSTNGVWAFDKQVDKVELHVGSNVALGAEVILRLVHGFGLQKQLDDREQSLSILKQELRRPSKSSEAVAVAFLQAGSRFPSDVSALAELLHKHLHPKDYLSSYSQRILQLVLVGRSPAESQNYCRKLVKAIPGHTILIGLANQLESPTSAAGLSELALRRMHAADMGHELVSQGFEDPPGRMVAESPVMKSVMALVERVAPANLPVLLTGETGTGKELVAAEIHRISPRSRGPLRTLNCGAIPAQLAESLLFGHTKGSFTGAVEDRAGIFEQASGGTVLLDEIGELPLELQAKLLRVLETKKVTRVGSHEETPFDARIIAATHRNLDEMAKKGSFREDLYYRLNGIRICLPPLRDRGDDILRIARRFLDNAIQKDQTFATSFHEGAEACMKAYSWPGNVRELRNVVERAIVLAQSTQITSEDFPPELSLPQISLTPQPSVDAAPTDPDEGLEEQIQSFESELLIAALVETKGNKSRAAVLLQMPRGRFTKKAQEHQVQERIAEGERAQASVRRLLGERSFSEAVSDLQCSIVSDALNRFSGNRSAAARSLNVPNHIVAYIAKKHSL